MKTDKILSITLAISMLAILGFASSVLAHTAAYWDGYNQGKTDTRNGNPIDAAATCDSFSFGNNKDWSHCVAGYNDAIKGGSSGHHASDNCTSEGCGGDYTCVNPNQPPGVPGCPNDYNRNATG